VYWAKLGTEDKMARRIQDKILDSKDARRFSGGIRHSDEEAPDTPEKLTDWFLRDDINSLVRSWAMRTSTAGLSA
jgi:hypothetical protein